MVRPLRLLAVATLVALVVGCTPAPKQDADLSVIAEKLAATLASGTVPEDLFTTDPGHDPAEELASIYASMGGIKPHVRVESVIADDKGGRGGAMMAYTWVIDEGKPAWQYTVPVGFAKGDQGWRVPWARQVVHLDLSPGVNLRVERLPARRGEIIGNADARLVFRQPVQRVGLDLTRIERSQAETSARALASELGIDIERYVGRVKQAGPKAFVEAQVLRVGDPAHRDALAAAEQIPGVRLLSAERMLARTPTFARPLLGITGEATAEAIERSHGLVRAGEVVGLTGVQANYDGHLRGVTGYVVSAERELFRLPARDGQDLRVTLDVDVQEAAEQRLAGVTTPASIVVLRVKDAAVLAAASGRGGQGLSTATRGLYPVPKAPRDVPVASGATSLTQATPLDVAAAAASAQAGQGLRPQLVLVGEGTPPVPLADAQGLEKWLDEVDADPGWAITRTADRIVVAQGAKPDALIAGLDVRGR